MCAGIGCTLSICLKKYGIPPTRHCSRIDSAHFKLNGRLPGPDSPPWMIHWIGLRNTPPLVDSLGTMYPERSIGPICGSMERKNFPVGFSQPSNSGMNLSAVFWSEMDTPNQTFPGGDVFQYDGTIFPIFPGLFVRKRKIKFGYLPADMYENNSPRNKPVCCIVVIPTAPRFSGYGINGFDSSKMSIIDPQKTTCFSPNFAALFWNFCRSGNADFIRFRMAFLPHKPGLNRLESFSA